MALSLRDPNGQVTLQAESCHSSLNTHIQQVMRQVMDAAMPPHIQLIRSVCQKHYSKANGNEQQVCFFNVGPPLTPEKVRKAAARIVRKSVDDQDIAISLNSTLYETGVSELFTSISLRRNGNLAYTQEPWNVNMVHAWSKSDKTISLCKHLIQVGLVRVVLRLDPCRIHRYHHRWIRYLIEFVSNSVISKYHPCDGVASESDHISRSVTTDRGKDSYFFGNC